jgi:hypothetical protein
MALIDKVRWSLLATLTIAMLASCGAPSREPEQPTGPSAAFKQAAVPDLSPPKGGDAAGALPSQVVTGEVAAFKGTSASAGIQKNRDTAGSLPSNVAAGKSAVYAPEGGQEPSSASRRPSARMAKP